MRPARLWDCCQAPSPCHYGCDAGEWRDGHACNECRASALRAEDIKHREGCSARVSSDATMRGEP